MGWSIHYDDESIFSDKNGSWHEAPCYGVLIIIEDRTWEEPDSVTGEYYKLVHMGSDYYLLRNEQIISFGIKDLHQHLDLGIAPHSIKYGRWTDNDVWTRVHNKVFPLSK
jgi:hypothetical protein